MNLKGSLPILILQVLARQPAHGYSIAQQIKERSAGVLDFREGTLYPALHSLEQKGLIESSERTEGGRPRRTYRLTEKGSRTLATEREVWGRTAQAISRILREA